MQPTQAAAGRAVLGSAVTPSLLSQDSLCQALRHAAAQGQGMHSPWMSPTEAVLKYPETPPRVHTPIQEGESSGP